MGRGKWSGTVGVLLLLAALVLTAHNLREARQAEHFSGETAAKLTEEISRRRTAREAEPEPQSEAPPEAEAESTDYLGLLELPTLSLTLPVAAEWSYPALKRTPCRYSGTAGEVSFVIIAHNYPAHFGRLWELEPGTEVYFTDMAGVPGRPSGAGAAGNGAAGAAAPRRYRGIVGAGADAAHLHTGRQKPRRGALPPCCAERSPLTVT